MIRRIALSCALSCASCGAPSNGDLEVAVVAVSGANPVAGAAIERVTATYHTELAGVGSRSVEADVVDGSFDLRVPIDHANAPMHVSLALHAASGVALVGGTPSFDPGRRASVSIVVGTPGTCEVVPELALPVAREDAAAVLLGEHVLVFGGTDATGPSVAIDAFDLLSLVPVDVPDAASPLGPTRAAQIDRNRALVVPTNAPAFIERFFADDPDSTRPEPSLHPGADTADAVVSVPGAGAVLVGGGPSVSPTGSVSWVLGTELVAQVATPTAAPDFAAVGAETGLWFVPNTNGASSLVQLQSSTFNPQVRVQSQVDGVRHGATLFAESSAFRLLLLGGTDENGAIRTDTIYFVGCPVGCGAAPSPTWTTARLGAAYDARGVIAGGDGPSALVDQVIVDAAGARIRPFATLVHARTHASVVRYPTGIVLVFGGRDAAGLVSDTEMCFPPSDP